MVAFFVSLTVFIADSIIHLYIQKHKAVQRGEDLKGALSKIVLMPSLYLTLYLASFAFDRPLASADLIYFIALFYTLGDLFLVFKNEIFFYIGVISFMAGHVFYIIYFSHFGFSYLTLAAGIIVYGALFARYCRNVMVRKPPLAAGYIAYGLMLLIFACGMASVFSFDHVYSSLLALAGVTVFAYSDTRIAYNMIGHGSTSDFTIMLTYVLANVLLVLSIWCINV